jgi:hypothetical protein
VSANASHPREWPTIAANMRDEAALQALHGLRALEPTTIHQMGPNELLARINQGMNALHKIEELMLAAGSTVRPLPINESPLLEQGTCRRITDRVNLSNYPSVGNKRQ